MACQRCVQVPTETKSVNELTHTASAQYHSPFTAVGASQLPLVRYLYCVESSEEFTEHDFAVNTQVRVNYYIHFDPNVV